MKLSQASVVLTGASGGIGAATARRLVYEGARVLLVGRTRQALVELASELAGGIPNRSRLDALIVDVTTEAGRRSVLDAARARNANVLINNAGISAFGALGSLADRSVEAALATNLLAPMLLTSDLLPHLLKQPRALVINIGSALGSIGVPGFSVYGATKAGLKGFTESLSRELSDTSVKVQYLAPRSVSTRFNDEQVQAFNALTGTASDSADQVARALVAMIETERRRRALGWFEGIASRLNGAWPGLLDGSFAKHRAALRTLSGAVPTAIEGEAS